MKKIVLFLVATLLVAGNCSPVTAQVAIGSVNDSITPGALLDLSQATDAGGLLLPQIESTDTLSDELRKPGMLVYNKTDGKVYTYNGAAWSAGGGGNPGPDPSSCSGTVTGVSGNEYPIGSYPNATNGLEYLCWTLSNLMEPGASFTSYPGETENRGYYYSFTNIVDDAAGTNLCTNTLSNGWHVPSRYEFQLLLDIINEMNADEIRPWVAGEGNAGYRDYWTSSWMDWNVYSRWGTSNVMPPSGSGYATTWYVTNKTTDGKYGKFANSELYFGEFGMSLRCVKWIM